MFSSFPHLWKSVVVPAGGKEDVDDAEGDDLEVLAAELAADCDLLPALPAAVGGLAVHRGHGRVVRHLMKYSEGRLLELEVIQAELTRRLTCSATAHHP